MSIATTLIATIEPDHTIKVPAHLPVGEQVLIVRMPSITALLSDDAPRARFAATRKAVQNAIAAKSPGQTLSNDEIVRLVKKARRATNS